MRHPPTSLKNMTPEELVLHKRFVAQRHRDNNREKIREEQRRCYHKNKKAFKERNTKWRANNQEKVAEYQRVYMAKKRRDAVERLGNKCCWCGESDYLVLTIDHINGDGHVERKSISNKKMLDIIIYSPLEIVKTRYQILCWNCQYRKKIKNKEIGSRVLRMKLEEA